MNPVLYIVSTPIGNLSDITLRALEVLQSVDIILCEDTRHSSFLLHHHGIKKKLISCHDHSSEAEILAIIRRLQAGETCALISDAGTPLVSDPGFPLLQKVRQLGLPYTAIPGSSAVINALALAGFPTIPFQFLGFTPKTDSERAIAFAKALVYEGTTLFFEAPHRLIDSLKELAKLSPERKMAVLREMTKMYEEIAVLSAEQLYAHFQATTPRGECVIAISPPDSTESWENVSAQEGVKKLSQAFGISISEAIKLYAQLSGTTKREIYDRIHRN